MIQFANHPDFYNNAIQLDLAEREKPIDILKDFFDSYYLYEVRQMLWNLFQVAMSTDNYLFAEFDKRDQLFLFYEKLEKLIEAGHLLSINSETQPFIVPS